jgi:ABC-2 type transport system permease protein
VRKAWIVARHEFAVTVKRVWFVIATFVFPLIFTGVGGGMLYLMQSTIEETQKEVAAKPLGLLDRSGELAAEPKSFQLLRFRDEETARRAVAAREVSAVLLVPEDWVRGETLRVLSSRRLTPMSSGRPALPEGLEDWLARNLLRDVDAARRDLARRPLRELAVVHLDEQGQPSSEDFRKTAARAGIAYVTFFLLFISIFSTSQYLLQGMAEEKDNKVMEMVLTSVTPAELMTGKLLGLGAAGLLQLGVWVAMGVASSLFVPLVAVALDPWPFVVCFVYFLLGYLLYGSLMLGFGALGTNLRESQQMASMWSLIGSSPVFLIFAIFERPQGGLAKTFSFIPFTAAPTMMLRFTVDSKGTPLWEILLSLALLAACTVLALRVSARLFRAGLLLYGKRPGLREIWRWVVAGR